MMFMLALAGLTAMRPTFRRVCTFVIVLELWLILDLIVDH